MSAAAIVLAAGQGTRFQASGGTTESKLVAALDGVPLVRRVSEAALASAAAPVFVVTGYARIAVMAALAGLAVETVHNPNYATGLSSSLRTGIAALPQTTVAAIVLLADMPLVTPQLIDQLLFAAAGHDAVVPVTAGRRGNPVVLSRTLFAAVGYLQGDAGARHLLRSPNLRVREIAVEGEASASDVDLVSDIERLRR